MSKERMFYEHLAKMVADERGGASQATLEDQALNIIDLSKTDMNWVSQVSEVIWHYLSDVDIRTRDTEYSCDQILRVAEVLSSRNA